MKKLAVSILFSMIVIAVYAVRPPRINYSLANPHFAVFGPLKGFYVQPLIYRHIKNNVLQMKSYSVLKTDATFRSGGINFDKGAIFCRMENYCLRSYNVKFSIHAGGFRE